MTNSFGSWRTSGFGLHSIETDEDARFLTNPLFQNSEAFAALFQVLPTILAMVIALS